MKPARVMLIIASLIAIHSCATAPQTSTQSAGAVIGAMSGSGMTGAVASAMIQNPELVTILMQQLGVTPVQAMGGAGSIFSMARNMMTPNNFSVLSKAVPNMDAYLAAAPKIAPNAMGGAASALRGTSIGNVATLASSFKSLGMGSGMVNQFIPVVLQYLQTQGGSSAMGLLQGAILP